jgi:hypothetical protein
MQKTINAVEDYLLDKKLIGSVVYGEPVEWTNADVNIKVFVRPLYNRDSVRGAVQAAVASVFAYNNVDFGRRISIGDVYRAALSTDGVDYIALNRLAETTGFNHAVVKAHQHDGGLRSCGDRGLDDGGSRHHHHL